jgi:hypothetical protein
MQVALNIKITDPVKKESTSVKENNVSKVSGITFMISTSRLWWLNMQNKQATMKWQENTVSPKANIWQ